MNLSTIIVALFVAVIFVAVLVYEIRKRKKGSCSCGCSGCGMSEICHKNKWKFYYIKLL